MEDNAYGPCCACGGEVNVRNIVMLNVKGTEAGTGWGCVLCHLPCDGALAVLCDDCLDKKKEPVFAVDGYLVEKKRIPIDRLITPHVHDRCKHPVMDTARWN